MLKCDYPLSGQIGFQDPGSKTLEGVIDLNDRISFYLIILLVLVFWFFLSSFFLSPYVHFSHGNLIEFIWTLTPATI